MAEDRRWHRYRVSPLFLTYRLLATRITKILERMNVRVDGSRCWSGWSPAVHKPGPLISSQTAFRKLRACDPTSRYWLAYLSGIYRGPDEHVDLLTIRCRVPWNVLIFRSILRYRYSNIYYDPILSVYTSALIIQRLSNAVNKSSTSLQLQFYK